MITITGKVDRCYICPNVREVKGNCQCEKLNYKSVTPFSVDPHCPFRIVNQQDNILEIDLLLAAILVNRFEPLAPHHIGALKERLGYINDEELWEFIRTGKKKNNENSNVER